MKTQFNLHLIQCEVCGNTLTALDVLSTKKLGYTVCHSINCQQVMSQQRNMSVVHFQSHLDFNRKLLRQQRARSEAKQKHFKQVNERERKQHQEILHTTLQQNPGLNEHNTQLVVLPSGRTESSPPAAARIDQYLQHLSQTIAEAETYSNVSEVLMDEHQRAYENCVQLDKKFATHPELLELSDRLCTKCKGGCCASGKEHAYLSVYSIRRYMDLHPDLTSDKILSLYRSKISNETIKDSCINHTPTGCALPRSLRSDICNSFYCEALKRLHKTPGIHNNQKALLVIQRSSSYWNRFDIGVENRVIDIELIQKN